MSASATTTTASPEEIAHFQAMADDWWDASGDFKPLHQLNLPRLAFAREALLRHFDRDGSSVRPFAGLSLLDVGCGGGLLCEPLSRQGFAVTGIDAGEKNITAARLHAEQNGLTIDYHCATPETLDEQYDVVTCMEVIEHVPDPDVFLAAVAARLKPGGAFLGATLNRTPQSFALAIVGAEYVLRWVPRGTHTWRKFIRPSEFAGALRRVGISAKSFEGARYVPLHDRWDRCAALDVNYSLYGIK
ncbi:bifunctional 2-polyprenyl-6-hydroxyphenol methylase/3-demethylubiquinol 3-O-methyltransferase UbiG [Telmatospirillum sp.]|uniref:bifunctional 2-polyprenyl-6-hydroxyphenol methylase/3-demethylubiquinol 3-O-methyltransferase UbiG n=1 Tax=Telmatospirillum sp. TaxID=2079197 RepID=UPI0028518FC3|nr:bifunctional 2-polyprenyl-6-hydroxyphenol methylase/3-demethylubiquinol 3-O-methyltransferase UbiG [Telmatospirillum sp.]MDR3438586.1 bifunctional 2-polyprenyl-6-hydroxyphenol methylase/3-demethylubiquinol 3-O-methyltransferase UbiG [Telmatospirillum sp.]